jgi:hypothetical protein
LDTLLLELPLDEDDEPEDDELPDDELELEDSFEEDGLVVDFFALDEFSIVSVTAPTFPSCVNPLLFWNALTASSVISPK